jgi:hypothetical protein
MDYECSITKTKDERMAYRHPNHKNHCSTRDKINDLLVNKRQEDLSKKTNKKSQ